FVFKLAWRVFAIGCGGIVLLGLLCVAASFLGGRQQTTRSSNIDGKFAGAAIGCSSRAVLVVAQ
ncbi:MAG: hypothetical protein HYY33_01395, partial [Chloroflexi bacterium]|nr:hypothetical protein [Chloroflexota bacterium]